MDLNIQNRTYHHVQGAMALLPNYYRWIYGAYLPFISGKVVELGCGAGLGLNCYLDRADLVYAVDHDDQLLAEIRTAYPTSRVKTVKADLLNEWTELQQIKADTVIMMDVVEHFLDDEQVFRKAADLLKPGGVLAVKVPAHSRLYSEIDEASGHYRRYDQSDLECLAERCGLQVSFLRRMNVAGAFVYRLRRKQRTNFSRTFSATQLKAINATLPVIRAADWIPCLPGLSWLGLFRRAQNTPAAPS